MLIIGNYKCKQAKLVILNEVKDLRDTSEKILRCVQDDIAALRIKHMPLNSNKIHSGQPFNPHRSLIPQSSFSLLQNFYIDANPSSGI